jgi:hypothetical protein
MQNRMFINKEGLAAVSTTVDDGFASIKLSNGHQGVGLNWDLYSAKDKRQALSELSKLCDAVYELFMAVEEYKPKK